MSTHVPGFQSFFLGFLHASFCIGQISQQQHECLRWCCPGYFQDTFLVSGAQAPKVLIGLGSHDSIPQIDHH